MVKAFNRQPGGGRWVPVKDERLRLELTDLVTSFLLPLDSTGKYPYLSENSDHGLENDKLGNVPFKTLGWIQFVRKRYAFY